MRNANETHFPHLTKLIEGREMKLENILETQCKYRCYRRKISEDSVAYDESGM